MQWLGRWHSKGNEPVHINRHGLFTLILTQELSRNGKELSGCVLETGKKLICTVADQSWQHIFLGAESLHRFERSLDELLPKKSPQHHYGAALLGKFLLENPTIALLSPGCPPVLWPEDSCCYTPTYCWVWFPPAVFPCWEIQKWRQGIKSPAGG